MQNFKIIRKAAKEYDWKFLAPIYDNKMESIL